MPIGPNLPRHPSWSFSWSPTTVPHVLASSEPTLSFHTTSPMRDYRIFGKTHTLPLALDEPSSIFSLTRNLPLSESITLKVGALVYHTKPNELPSGLYLSRGYTQVSPLVGVEYSPVKRLGFSAALSAGPMITEPDFGDGAPVHYVPYTNLTPGLVQKMNFAGWGATAQLGVSLAATKWLSLEAGVIIHGDQTRKLYNTTGGYDQYTSLSSSFNAGIRFTLR